MSLVGEEVEEEIS